MSILRPNTLSAIFAATLIGLINAQTISQSLDSKPANNNITQSLVPKQDRVKSYMNDETHTNHNKVQMRGNTLVIIDASCNAHGSLNAVSALKDSKYTPQEDECETSKH